MISQFRSECRAPYRKPLHFIVMSVMVATAPIPMRFLCVTVPDRYQRHRHFIVTLIVMEKKAYLCAVPACVTVMTLMTVVFGNVLKRRCLPHLPMLCERWISVLPTRKSSLRL
jgi:hypothetical protein